MSGSSSSNMEDSLSSSIPTIPPTLKYVMTAIKTIGQTPLTHDNFHIWSIQIQKLLSVNGFEKFLDHTILPPPQFLPTDGTSTTPNPQYASWHLVDQNLATLLLSTISTAILPYVLHLHTTAEIWHSLTRRLQGSTRSRILQLKNELHNVSMKTNTMNQYLSEVKQLVDHLAAAGAPIDKEDVILYILKGLPPQYQSFKAAIRTRPGSIELDEFYSMLSSEEINISTEVTQSLHNLALYSNRGRSNRPYNRGRGRSFSRGGRSSTDRSPRSATICQICNKTGHSARTCWHRQNLDYQPPPPPPDNSAFVSNISHPPSSAQSEEWHLDSGATANLTPHLHHLQQPQFYPGYDQVTMGSGQSLPISHVGNSILITPNRKFHLSTLYRVPKLNHNLLSVQHFTTDNNCSISFSPNHFSIKDLTTKQVLHRGPCRNGLYSLPSISALHTSLSVPALWHYRLGHPQPSVLQEIAKTNTSLHIPCSSFFCSTCTSAKSHRLVFPNSVIKSTSAFQLIHTDLWGPSPVMSIDGYSYYISFVDDYTRYTWIFPLHHKSQSLQIFSYFQAHIKTQFQATIQTLRSDGGGEFTSRAFRHHLLSHGIHHQLSCPYTPEQNGVAERKHRHIIETTRTLLHTANLPLQLWLEAAQTAVYLINRLPSKTLSMKSPYELLYHSPPTYHHLRVFGSTCYPWQVPQRPSKLHLNAPSCIFVGYSPQYKGYRCFNPSTQKIIISRHVVFNESFPPSHISPDTSQTSSSSTYIPPTLLPPASISSNPTPPEQHPLPPPNNAMPTSPSPSTSTGSSPSTTPTPQPPPDPSTNQLKSHPMLTRQQTGNHKPKIRFDLHHKLSPDFVPATYSQVITIPAWQEAMTAEIRALHDQATWTLVEPPPGQSILGSKWTFKIKRHQDGSIARHKARLVAQGFNQTYGLDYVETFSPVASFPTIRLFLLTALHLRWDIQQIDISNAFLHGSLQEKVYMTQPKGYEDPSHPTAVCLLNKAIYGLKQAPRQWHSALTGFLKSLGFQTSQADPSLLLRRTASTTVYVLIYVDDLLVSGNDTTSVQEVLQQLSKQFHTKLLGNPTTYLGIQIISSNNRYFLHQHTYLLDLLKAAGMSDCSSVSTPTAPTKQPVSADLEPLSNPSHYRKLAGSLQYLTITRPDIAYAVNQICQHMHSPQIQHYNLIVRVLRYLKGTSTHGLPISSGEPSLQAFVDSDWAGDLLDRRSTTGYCIYFLNTLILWKVQKQRTVARSSTEAEYRALASAASDILWLRKLLHDFGFSTLPATSVYCDSQSALFLAKHPVLQARTKHIEIDQHFLREHIAAGTLQLHHIPSTQQAADIFTKGLSRQPFQHFRDKLTIQSLDAFACGGVIAQNDKYTETSSQPSICN